MNDSDIKERLKLYYERRQSKPRTSEEIKLQSEIKSFREKRAIELVKDYNAILQICKNKSNADKITYIEDRIKDELSLEKDNTPLKILEHIIIDLFSKYYRYIQESEIDLNAHIDEAGGIYHFLREHKDKIFTRDYFNNPKINCIMQHPMSNHGEPITGDVVTSDVKADLKFINDLIDEVIRLEKSADSLTGYAIKYTKSMKADLEIMIHKKYITMTDGKPDFKDYRYAIAIVNIWDIVPNGSMNPQKRTADQNKYIMNSFMYKGHDFTKKNCDNARQHYSTSYEDELRKLLTRTK